MKHEPRKRMPLPLRPGQEFRCPDKATAKWRRVLACVRRRDGSAYVTIRTDRWLKKVGGPAKYRIDLSTLTCFGYGVRG